MEPLITVITVTYNAEGCIAPTMRSVAEQTFNNYEHLVIDGASKDRTAEVVRELSTPSTRLVSEPDKGLYDAMNKGLRLARGRYVIFLNAGDAFASRASLQKYAEAAEKGVAIIYSDTVLVDADRNVVGPRHLSVPKRLTRGSFSRGMLICHQAFMVRRDIAPAYDLRYRFSADYDWTVKCIEKTSPDDCINLNGVHIHYLTDGLTDKNMKASLKERFAIMRRHYGLITALMRHASFVPRFIIRKLRPHPTKNVKMRGCVFFR